MILASGLAVFLLGSTATALGANIRDEAVPRVIVHFEELDISRPAGARVLYKRIQRAAVKVCSKSVYPYTIPLIKRSSCYRNAMENAVAQVDSPELMAIYRDHFPRLASE
jgi:UrcA family protein